MKIISYLQGRALTAKEYIAYCKELIRNIKNILPNMQLSILDDEDNVYFFQENLSNFSQENLYKIIMEDQEIVYHNPNKENKNLTIDSTSWMPFSSLFFLNKDKDMNIYKESDISISISQGVEKFSSPAMIKIEFSQKFLDKLNFEIIKKLFICLEKTNDLQYAILISDEFWDEIDNDDSYDLWIGYLTYFANKDVFRLLENISNIDILETKFGAIINLQSLEFSEENIEKAIQIRDILGKNDLLNVH